jgi:hypothetical protein
VRCDRPEDKRAREREKEMVSGSGSGSDSGWRPFFKTHYGRTGQSTVPVRLSGAHRTAHREKEDLRAPAGAPDSAHRTVR